MRSQAEANLSAFIESTNDLIWSVDLDDRLITFNSALRQHIESAYGVRLAAGMRLRDLLPPERTGVWPAFYARALAQGPFRVEYSLPDGRSLDLAFNPIVVDGKAAGVSVFGMDITRRKAAESALREAEKKYRDIFEGALEGMCRVSLEGKILTANPATARILGYDSADELMSTVKDLAQDMWLNPKERDRYLEQLAEHGVARGFECQFKRKDGTLIWVSLHGRRVCGGDGQLLYFEGFLEEITERKLAEMQLLESEERYRATFEQSAVGIVHTSLDGRVLRCNRFFADFLGYAPEEVAGIAIQQITAPEDRARSLDVIEQVRNDSAFTTSFEKRYLRKDGTPVWAKLTVSVQRNAQGSALHLITVVEDINSQKRAADLLVAAMEALRLSEERYRTAFQTSLDGIAISQMSDGRYLDVNKAFLDLMGFEREEIVVRTSLELNLWVDAGDRQEMVAALRERASFRDMQTRFVRKNGKIIWVLVSASAIEIDGVPCILSVVRDITEAKAAGERLAAATEALRVSEERYRTAFQTSIDAININRLSDGLYIDCNQAFLDTMGYKREEVLGRTSLELDIWGDSRDRQTLLSMMRQNSSCRGMEVRFRKKNGETIWGQMSASVVEIDGVPCILSITRDISSAKAAEKTIRSLAFYDPLTGLPNRRLLLEQLRLPTAAGDRRGRSLALLLINLDHFKILNDTLGHQAGDLLLKDVARRVAASVQEGDIVCRMGGDEFVVLLENLSDVAREAAVQAEEAGKKILAAIDQPYPIEDREYLLTASIGITVFEERQSATGNLLQQADIALDHAKAAGRNTLRFFSPALQSAVNTRATLENELRQAIKAKQFLLYYQPQVERGRLTGAEALIRWKHPRRGIVPPDEFISLAEESRLILPIGEWVLEAACAQIASWAGRKEITHLTVAVNISALQFRQPEFVERVLAALDRTGANPESLKLELTESILVDNIEAVIDKMIELKSHGLSFSLDDFGTGYSSLAYLKRLPLDYLKIDRSFVHDMLEDAASGAIAATIIALGRAMGISVIAEGVETEEQRCYLAGIGCHSFQGYLFSRPLPLEQFEAFVKKTFVSSRR